MSEIIVLQELKQKIESLKRDSAIKEGEIKSISEQIKKDFDVKSLEEAYEKLVEMEKDIEAKKGHRDELLKEASEKLDNYRR